MGSRFDSHIFAVVISVVEDYPIVCCPFFINVNQDSAANILTAVFGQPIDFELVISTKFCEESVYIWCEPRLSDADYL